MHDDSRMRQHCKPVLERTPSNEMLVWRKILKSGGVYEERVGLLQRALIVPLCNFATLGSFDYQLYLFMLFHQNSIDIIAHYICHFLQTMAVTSVLINGVLNHDSGSWMHVLSVLGVALFTFTWVSIGLFSGYKYLGIASIAYLVLHMFLGAQTLVYMQEQFGADQWWFGSVLLNLIGAFITCMTHGLEPRMPPRWAGLETWTSFPEASEAHGWWFCLKGVLIQTPFGVIQEFLAAFRYCNIEMLFLLLRLNAGWWETDYTKPVGDSRRARMLYEGALWSNADQARFLELWDTVAAILCQNSDGESLSSPVSGHQPSGTVMSVDFIGVGGSALLPESVASKLSPWNKAISELGARAFTWAMLDSAVTVVLGLCALVSPKVMCQGEEASIRAFGAVTVAVLGMYPLRQLLVTGDLFHLLSFRNFMQLRAVCEVLLLSVCFGSFWAHASQSFAQVIASMTPLAHASFGRRTFRP
ncbi:MAG: hypothetical protein MHM6MM_008445, partial [Cercozoa sp. M6MM]